MIRRTRAGRIKAGDVRMAERRIGEHTGPHMTFSAAFPQTHSGEHLKRVPSRLTLQCYRTKELPVGIMELRIRL